MALVINGTNQYALVNLTTLITGADAFSIAFTFKTGASVTGALRTVFSMSQSSGNWRGIGLSIRSDGSFVAVQATGSESEGSSPWFGVVAQPNTVYRCVLTKATSTTGNLKGYLNVITNTYTRATLSNTYSLTRFCLGAAIGNSAYQFFGGKMVRVAFWPSLLSTADINVCLNASQTPSDCSVAPQDYWQAVSSDSPTIGSNSLTRFNSAVYDSDSLLPPVITAMNGGNPVKYGQSGIAVTATGFASIPTSVTVTHASGTLATSNITGTATSFTFDLQDRSEGTDWPLDAEIVQFTFIESTNSASITRAVSKKTGEEKLTFALADTANVNSLAYHLNAAGYTVNGGELVFTPYADLDLDPENDGTTDGNFTVSSLGTFPSWFRPATGTGAGNVYYFNWTVDDGAVIVNGGGLTSSGLTSVGFTASGFYIS